mmetsp:Transcript_6486/g.11575  ORF Transcript_6486/g.11575 Transcript_6486/m.11575 type:complete len:85 (+) Transcript_6486:586-840(+)
MYYFRSFPSSGVFHTTMLSFSIVLIRDVILICDEAALQLFLASARHGLERNLELSSWIMRVPLNYLYYVICPCCQLRDGVTRRL